MMATGCPRLDADLAAFRALTTLAPQSAQELETALGEAYTRLLQADLATYDVAAIRERASDALDDMFQVRVKLRDRIGEWRQKGFMTKDVERNLRGVFRTGRYATDMLAELILAPAFATTREGKKHNNRAFTGNQLATAINPAHQTANGFDFQSGDVLLVRGGLSTSAAIARIGDIDSQFSHVGLIHVDPDGTAQIIEALIEKGSVVNTLTSALDHGLGRAVLFRARDPQLGARAAEWAKAHVERSNTSAAPHIPYDFTMQLPGYDNLFCSKMIRMAYDAASDGALLLPTFPTSLSMSNRDFVERIGVTAHSTFAPGDMELEPAFDLVAEWRDVTKTANLRLQDAILDKHFAWMDNHGYVYSESFKIWLFSILGRISAYMPQFIKNIFVGMGLPEVPLNMKRRTIAAVMMLTFTTDPILRRLEAVAKAHSRKTGRPMHLREVYNWLEGFRADKGRRIGYLVKRRVRRA